jgi:hypothetical protein
MTKNIEKPAENIEIIVTVSRKRGTREDKTSYDFPIYSGFTKNGKKCRFKLTRNVQNAPTTEGVYKFLIPRSGINKDKTSIYNQFWIDAPLISATPFERTFDSDEELPF